MTLRPGPSARRLAFLVATSALLAGPGPASADLLDPSAFASLGPLGPGSYGIMTGDGSFSPVLYDTTTGATLATGVVSNGVAVFDFAAITGGASFVTSGLIPVALLSTGDVSIASVQVAATSLGGGGGAAGGLGGSPDSGVPNGRHSPAWGSTGGQGAGGLLSSLTGGTVGPGNAGGSGLGGGAIEIVGLGAVEVGGISAVGLSGRPSTGFGAYTGGGGGGGGGVVVAGYSVTLDGAIDVSGGLGGRVGYSAGGGGGGGGEIDILYGAGGLFNDGALIASGGAGGGGYGGTPASAGLAGTISIQDPPIGGIAPAGIVVPEPATLGLLALGLGGLAASRRRSKERLP